MNYVAYYRVSTDRQGLSGLGLDSQKTIVSNFIGANNLLAEFTEIESGKSNNRLELNKAIEYCKMNNCTLVIAKLDRLSRNIQFIFALRDSKVNFVACDIPDANTLTIGIFAVIAQQERETISERTKNALQALKAKGIKLGHPENLTDISRSNSIAVRKEIAKNNPNTIKATALISALASDNLSLRGIAKILNENGFRTPKGFLFTATAVKIIKDKL